MHKKNNHIFIRVHALPGERFLLQGLIAAIFLSILGYTYFVSLSIRNVIMHKEAIAQSERLQSDVGNLEKKYFELSQKVTPDLAAGLGMAPANGISFVRRPGSVGAIQVSRGI